MFEEGIRLRQNQVIGSLTQHPYPALGGLKQLIMLQLELSGSSASLVSGFSWGRHLAIFSFQELYDVG
jgi:hypothetical protein